MSSLMNKVVVITGSASGIGAATALEFAKHACKLVMVDLNKNRLQDMVKQCMEKGAQKAIPINVDLTEDAGLQTIVKDTLDTYGGIDVLVNNAGARTMSDLGGLTAAKGSAEGLDFNYNLLLRSPWKLCGLFIDELIKTKGCIINISSAVSQIAYPKNSGYIMMKAALNQMTKLLAAEFGMKGVRVNAVQPGFTSTRLAESVGIMDEQVTLEMFQALANKGHILEQKLCTPEDLAKTIVFLASDDARMLTGVCVPVDGGFTLAHPLHNFAGTS